MLAPVARPGTAAVWGFLNVILIEYTLGSIKIQDYGTKNPYTYSGIDRTKISECAHNRIGEEESSLIDASSMDDIRLPKPGYGRTDSEF
jgi:hypothetical protein